VLERLKRWAAELKAQVVTLWFCRRDPRTPLSAKILAGVVVAYAFSPIDLIPDFIPVLGYLDDLILVPLGIYLTIRLIPPPVLADARREADAWLAQRRSKPKSYWAAAFVIVVWLAVAYWAWTVVREHW
jgi:uncharacterized membrane protein YkvA (DUF1232 family)